MKDKDFMNAFNKIDDKFIDEAKDTSQEPIIISRAAENSSNKKYILMKTLKFAACAAVICAVAIPSAIFIKNSGLSSSEQPSTGAATHSSLPEATRGDIGILTDTTEQTSYPEETPSIDNGTTPAENTANIADETTTVPNPETDSETSSNAIESAYTVEITPETTSSIPAVTTAYDTEVPQTKSLGIQVNELGYEVNFDEASEVIESDGITFYTFNDFTYAVVNGNGEKFVPINVGDTFNGLTLKKASVVYQANNKDNFHISAMYAELEGTITLKGYIILTEEDVGISDKGIIFHPEHDEWYGRPAITLSSMRVDAETPGFLLGYMDIENLCLQNNKSINLEAVPTDYTPVYAEVTIKNPVLGSTVDASGFLNNANLLEVKEVMPESAGLTTKETGKIADITINLDNSYRESVKNNWGCGHCHFNDGSSAIINNDSTYTFVPAEEGCNVYAISGGTVTFADYDGKNGYRICVEHADGTHVNYCHLSSMNVNVGDVIAMDHVIGCAGSTGLTDCSGVSYHYHCRSDNHCGYYIQPTPSTTYSGHHGSHHGYGHH